MRARVLRGPGVFMKPWHLRLSVDGRHPMFPTEARRRAALHALARVARGEIAIFCLVDDHLHVVLYCGSAAATIRARAISRTVRRLAAVPLEATHLRAVESRRHMHWLLKYVLEQPGHHGLSTHPALWTGGCFADLAGARVLPGLGLRIAQALPRFRLSEACRLVGLGEDDLRPPPPERVRALGAVRVVAAAAAVLAADPKLTGRGAPEATARPLAGYVGRRAGIAHDELAWALRRSDRQLRRAARTRPDPRLERALQVRLALEEVAGERRGP